MTLRVLAIGAHFDDVELGCGGTLARHSREGDFVAIYVATHSGYSNYAQRVIRRPEIAHQEGKKAADILGVNRLIAGNFPTNNLQFNDQLACALIQVIEEYEIDLVYTHWAGDVHLDHQVLGRATLSAARHVPRLLMYRSNYYDAFLPFHGNYYVDITATVEIKRQAVMAHQSEYTRVGKKWLSFFLNQNANDGQKIGVAFAECFQVIKYLY